jgi:hypothetical protein
LVKSWYAPFGRPGRAFKLQITLFFEGIRHSSLSKIRDR